MKTTLFRFKALSEAVTTLSGVVQRNLGIQDLSNFLNSGVSWNPVIVKPGHSAWIFRRVHLSSSPMALEKATIQVFVEPYMALQGRERKNDATREKNLRAGIACMDQVVAKSPKSWSAFWVRGKAHQALGDHGSAEQSFQAAYDIKPDEIDVGRELGLEELELNQWGKASRVFQVLVDGHPTDAGMRANLALSFLLDGDPKRAKAEITQARKLEPNDPVSKKVEERIDEVASGKRPQPTSLREIER